MKNTGPAKQWPIGLDNVSDWFCAALGRGPIIGVVAIRPTRIGVYLAGPVIFI